MYACLGNCKSSDYIELCGLCKNYMGYVKLLKPLSHFTRAILLQGKAGHFILTEARRRECTQWWHSECLSTKRPALYAQQVHREVDEEVQAVASTKPW